MPEITMDEVIGRAAMRKAALRLLPLIGAGFAMAYVDRVNISFASLRMNADLNFSASVYGTGAGLFFLTYAFLEVPSNLMLLKVGPRLWLARIMITWGAISAATMFVQEPWHFYVVRLALGAAEAGFFPGVVYYLSRWFPETHRGRMISRFYIALPISSIVSGTVAGALLGLDGIAGFKGWQWLFLIEGLPTIIIGLMFWIMLDDGPENAAWLTPDERSWLLARRDNQPHVKASWTLLSSMLSPPVLIFGAMNFCLLGTTYGFGFSAPHIIETRTGLSIASVGYITALSGALGIPALLCGGWLADGRLDRKLVSACIIVCGAAGLLLVRIADMREWVILGYLAFTTASYGVHGIMWAIPSEFVKGPSSAIAIAAMSMIGMFGSMLAPVIWGFMRDASGGYEMGMSAVPMLYLCAAALMLVLRYNLSGKRGLSEAGG
jgi:ACS family tartrate transporter-like MFS transporter